jgi:MFS family permease
MGDSSGLSPALLRANPPLWRNRDFLLASTARFMAAAGMGAVIVSVMLHLQAADAAGTVRLAGSWLVALYLLCSALPLVVLAPWAGRLADTRDSRVLATATSAGSAAAVAGMGLSMHYLEHYISALFALTLVLNACQAVAGPTWQALLPRIVGEERTPRAVGTMQATIMIAGMAGPAAGGLLSGWGGSVLVFSVASACYVAMGLGAVLIRTRRGTGADLAGRERPALMDGLRLIRRDSLVWALVIGTLFFIAVGEATNVLEVFLVRGEMGASETEYGLLVAAFALGMAAGAALAGLIKTPPVRLRILLGSMALTSAVLACIGLVPSVDIMFVAYTGMGVSCGVLNACFGAIVILRIPEEGRGQAMSMIGGLIRAISLAALALGGLLGALLPVRSGFLLIGGIGAVVSLAIAIRVLWRFGSQDLAPARPGDAGQTDAGADDGADDPDGPDGPAGAATAGPTVSGRAALGSGRQQESVADQVPHIGEKPVPERAAVKPVFPAQQRFKGSDDLPDGQVAVAR